MKHMIKEIFSRVFSIFKTKKTEKQSGKTIYEDEERGIIPEIYSLWDYINPLENTQAHHILSVIGFDEWVPMDEIKRRIRELFSIEYKNDRSLYPYIKTMVDVGLLESINAGGKRKWRKRDLIIKVKEKIREKEEERLLAFEKSIQ
ncbi:MAG: hypothetical protein COT90_01145 [Candidatus Diapherotrites archaeon CG10_big_fil_rev_8_21_14_0_10_31_34]|nr:MAG: hypothetical protein COT90_01145 [Candidatus Diapherotrites archaeon CG10_big_fil_rev_8_21_14_0_10_31_34]